ncbi:MAG TPA: lipid-A-disaccharide synthase, partial [Planctomycetota bacterium]|nr:lipid-A-disaccharide synthase [Planctomycetota bacterium]
MTHVLVSAAEASGDQHAAHVVEAIRAARPEIEFTAFGGPSLARAAGSLEADLVGSATMVLGFVGELGKFARILRRFDEILATRRPDAVLCVDSPGLHFLFARLAAWQGVPVIYYICPQIWAWAPWRRRKVLRYTDLLLPILPFEE